MLDHTPPALTDHQSAILGVVLAQPEIRRDEVSKALGISAQTTMRAVLPLIDAGLLDEKSVPGGGRGKPARQLVFVPGSLATVGISLAVDRVRVEVCDLAGLPLSSVSRAKTYDSASVQMQDLDQVLDLAMADTPATTQIMGLGVSVQGYLMSGGTRFAAKADPAGWAQIDLPAQLSQRFGAPVHLMNDGRTLASSLIRSSPYQDFICLHIGTGIGGGSVSKGTLVPGANGNAGELGALFPEGPDRPIESAFLRAAGLENWDAWTAPNANLAAFLDQAAGQISDAVGTALALLDFEAVYICSRMPQDLLQALCDRIRVDPIGFNRFGGPLAARNPPPKILAHHVPNYARLACRMAVETALPSANQISLKG